MCKKWALLLKQCPWLIFFQGIQSVYDKHKEQKRKCGLGKYHGLPVSRFCLAEDFPLMKDVAR